MPGFEVFVAVVNDARIRELALQFLRQSKNVRVVHMEY